MYKGFFGFDRIIQLPTPSHPTQFSLLYLTKKRTNFHHSFNSMGSKQRKWGIHLKTVYCPNCQEEQPKVRKPQNWRQILWGGYTCQNCGTEMDKYGKKLK